MIEAKTQQLRALLRDMQSVVVAFSGGADSAFLAWVANDELGDHATVVTAVSESLAPEEAADCERLAAEWGLHWRRVETLELSDPRYQINDSNRCFYCKTSLMDELEPVAEPLAATIVLGVNVDDLGDHRPGQKAAAERGAKFPLVDAGFTKAELREASRALGLRTWDKPAAACLSSRLPYGTPVTLTTLSSVARAESALRKLGFNSLRVRHYDNTARVEVPLDELPDVIRQRDAVVNGVKAAGYEYVTLDLDGLRSGNLNQALDAT
jgi:pyridinium-3,5-biscarboxylic acid mononucleotide sulfurtransferase